MSVRRSRECTPDSCRNNSSGFLGIEAGWGWEALKLLDCSGQELVVCYEMGTDVAHMGLAMDKVCGIKDCPIFWGVSAAWPWGEVLSWEEGMSPSHSTECNAEARSQMSSDRCPRQRGLTHMVWARRAKRKLGQDGGGKEVAAPGSLDFSLNSWSKQLSEMGGGEGREEGREKGKIEEMGGGGRREREERGREREQVQYEREGWERASMGEKRRGRRGKWKDGRRGEDREKGRRGEDKSEEREGGR